MKKIITAAMTSGFFLQTAQAHQSHSEGGLHAAEHFIMLLIPLALWCVYTILKKRSSAQSKRRDSWH